MKTTLRRSFGGVAWAVFTTSCALSASDPRDSRPERARYAASSADGPIRVRSGTATAGDPDRSDDVAAIDTPLRIVAVGVRPSRVVETCAVATLSASASDLQDALLTYRWGVVAAPDGADYSLVGNGASASFAGAPRGRYTLRLTVEDPVGSSQSLDFPIHLTGEADGRGCDARQLTGEDALAGAEDDPDSEHGSN